MRLWHSPRSRFRTSDQYLPHELNANLCTLRILEWVSFSSLVRCATAISHYIFPQTLTPAAFYAIQFIYVFLLTGLKAGIDLPKLSSHLTNEITKHVIWTNENVSVCPLTKSSSDICGWRVHKWMKVGYLREKCGSVCVQSIARLLFRSNWERKRSILSWV